MDLAFTQLEALIARLPINESTYAIFDELLSQPYDIFRTVLDLLFEESVTVDDLTLPVDAPYLGTLLADVHAAATALHAAGTDAGRLALMARCRQLMNGRHACGTVVERDNSAFMVAKDGTLNGVYAPSEGTHVGADAATIVPNPIERARLGSIQAAQKDLQRTFLAASRPRID